jgi:signal peptidase
VTTSVRVTSSNATSYCAEVTVSTTSTSWVRWQTTIDRTTAGLTPQHWLDARPGNAWNVSTVSFTPATGSWVVRGSGWNDHVRADTPRTFGYCSPTSQTALAMPLTEADVSVTITSESGNGSKATYCAAVTVSTSSADWIRWRTTVSAQTPGLSGPRYRLSEEPASPTNATTTTFTAQGNNWSWTVTGAVDRWVRAGTPATWTFCK